MMRNVNYSLPGHLALVCGMLYQIHSGLPAVWAVIVMPTLPDTTSSLPHLLTPPASPGSGCRHPLEMFICTGCGVASLPFPAYSIAPAVAMAVLSVAMALSRPSTLEKERPITSGPHCHDNMGRIFAYKVHSRWCIR